MSARVDILLALRAQLDGLNAGRAALRGFGGDLQAVNAQARNTARSLGGDFDTVIASIRRKFTAAKLGEALLGGIGVGTALAVVNLTVEKWRDVWQEAEKRAAAMQERAEKIRDAMREVRDIRFENFLNQQDTPTQLRLREAELAAKQREIEAQKAREAGAMRGLKWIEEQGGGSVTNVGLRVQRFEGEKFGGETGMGGRAFWEAMDKRADEARLKVEQLEKDAEQIRAKIIPLQQQIEKTKQEDAEKKAKEAEQALKDLAEASETLTQENQRTDEAQRRLNDRFAKSAQQYRELADPQEKYQKRLTEIAALERTSDAQGKPFLSAAEAAAARARVLAEMNDTVGKALAAARDEVAGFDRALRVLDANPYLTDNEKQAQRVALFEAQAAAIAKLKAQLQELAAANPAMAAQIGGEVRSLDEAGARGAAKSFAPPGALDQARTRFRASRQGGYGSVGAGIEGAALDTIAQIGTAGDQAARAFRTSFDSAFGGVRTGLRGLLDGTRDLKGGVADLAAGLRDGVVDAVADMATDWIKKKTMMFLFGRQIDAAEVAATATMETAKTGIHASAAAANTSITVGEAATTTAATAPAGIFHSIMQLGPIAGPVVFASAIAAMLALVGSLSRREFGGPVSAGMPYLVGERRPEIFVPSVSGTIVPSVGAYTAGVAASSRAGGGSPANNGREMSLALIDARDSDAVERVLRDPRFEARFVHLQGKHRHRIGVRL